MMASSPSDCFTSKHLMPNDHLPQYWQRTEKKNTIHLSNFKKNICSILLILYRREISPCGLHPLSYVL